MAETEQWTQFCLNLLNASCHLSMKEDCDDDSDIRPLCDFLIPKGRIKPLIDVFYRRNKP